MTTPSLRNVRGDGVVLLRARFEFREGTSDKFWEISVGNSEFTVRFGKRGFREVDQREVEERVPRGRVDAAEVLDFLMSGGEGVEAMEDDFA